MKASKLNFVGRMQRWMDSVPGQTFLNYAYSWGASIVILGALFKLTHLPLANLMLYIGMGTEVFVFFISAFDRPFNKSDESRELTNETLAEIAAADADSDSSETVTTASHPAGGSVILGGGSVAGAAGQSSGAAAGAGVSGVSAGSTIIIGGSGALAPSEPTSGAKTSTSEGEAQPTLSAGLQQAAAGAGITATNLADIIRMANEELLKRAQASMTPEMEEASQQYVEKLKLLTETLDRVEKQSARLTTDSEEMTNLNRTLTGINTVYELQLKSISQQVGSIDQINEQTRKMAQQIEDLNAIYARMIKALTVNMKNAAPQPES